MRYNTDLTDEQWAIIEPVFLAKIGKYGNRAKWERRELMNAVLYLVKTDCQWRMLPNDFPPYKTVYSFFRRMRLDGVWEQINDLLVQKVRISAGRAAKPTYALIDSQSVKTTGAALERGIDGGKKDKR
jgi:putative transposase